MDESGRETAPSLRPPPEPYHCRVAALLEAPAPLPWYHTAYNGFHGIVGTMLPGQNHCLLSTSLQNPRQLGCSSESYRGQPPAAILVNTVADDVRGFRVPRILLPPWPTSDRSNEKFRVLTTEALAKQHRPITRKRLATAHLCPLADKVASIFLSADLPYVLQPSPGRPRWRTLSSTGHHTPPRQQDRSSPERFSGAAWVCTA